MCRSFRQMQLRLHGASSINWWRCYIAKFIQIEIIICLIIWWWFITGVIEDKNILPITRLNFGRTQLETSSGVHTLGRFECTGQVAVTGMPSSCEDLWRMGHTLSGLYSVVGSSMIESVYCDFAKLPNDSGYL